jgi:hypothetical protein
VEQWNGGGWLLSIITRSPPVSANTDLNARKLIFIFPLFQHSNIPAFQ